MLSGKKINALVLVEKSYIFKQINLVHNCKGVSKATAGF